MLSSDVFCCTLRSRLHCRQGLVATSCMAAALHHCHSRPVVCQTACDAERVGGQRGGRARRGGSAASVSASTPPTWPHRFMQSTSCCRKLSAARALHRAACRAAESCAPRRKAAVLRCSFSWLPCHACSVCQCRVRVALTTLWPVGRQCTHYLVARGSTMHSLPSGATVGRQCTHHLVARGSAMHPFARCSAHACSVHP